jgi:hypothetical protein
LQAIFYLFFSFGSEQKYIEDKDNKLRRNAYNYFNDFFRYQDVYVDTDYSNQQVKYIQSSNPEKRPKKDDYLFEDWNEKFSDIYKLFKIDNIYNGWQLFIAQRSGQYLITYYICPSYVGYKKQKYQYGYNWIPSVPNCVEEAYDFWTTNDKSQYIDNYRKGNKRIVENFISDFGNEYYDFTARTETINSRIGTAGWMYNGFYKVFAERSNYTYYEIARDEYTIEKDKTKILTVGIITLTIAFIFITILFVVKISRK